MNRDKYGRFASKSGVDKEKPKRDAKGRFLPKEHKAVEDDKRLHFHITQHIKYSNPKNLIPILDSYKSANNICERISGDIQAINKAMRGHEEIENKKQKTEPDWPQEFNEVLNSCKIDVPECPKINFPKYTIDDIRHAFIAGLNDSQGILPLSKRFEMYCKRNGIT